jgi:hypothetical protein
MNKKVYFEDPELEQRITLLKKHPPHEIKAMETFLDILKETAPHLFPPDDEAHAIDIVGE